MSEVASEIDGEKGEDDRIKLDDDSPGVCGEMMFVNTDNIEEEYNLPYPTHDSELNDSSSAVKACSMKICDDKKISNLQDSLCTDSFTENEMLSDNEDSDLLTDPAWISNEKHIFILSESGKPIYTRYGKEDRLVTLFGLMQALVSFVADGGDFIKSIHAGGHKFVFLMRSPLILVAVSKSPASDSQLVMQLTYVHSQIVSVLTASALTKTFEKRRNYDFRRMLGGEGRLLDNLLGLFNHHPSFMLGAIQCLPMNNSIRDTITQTIIQFCSKIKNLVFGLIICKNQLISLVRMKQFLLHPADLHLLFNLIDATESLKVSENWMPICLPKFDPKGYLYGHVSYLSEECEACLILLSVDKEHFSVLSEAKQKIVERLRRHHCLEKINQAICNPPYNSTSCGSLHLRHFIYKSKSTAQYTCPVYTAPYTDPTSQKKLFGFYKLLHHRIHSVSRPLKMIFMSSDTETLVGWVTKEFELYCTYDPIISKATVVVSVNKILAWVKSEENKLFILNSPTF